MHSWTLVHSSPAQGRTFARPLDVTELSFLWDGLFTGTADNLQHFQLRLFGLQDAHIFSDANIVRAWLSTKRRYPLAGASVNGGVPDPSGHFESEPRFIVRENDLKGLRPDEITFGSVSSAEEARERAEAIIHGPRPLSDDLLAKLYVFREKERADVLHLFTLVAHCITDGVAMITFVRCLLDTLASGSEPPTPPLDERLSMTISSHDLEPAHLRSLSPARRRWRRAIGFVIFQLRQAKRQGGHTLPCRIRHSTPRTPARSCFLSTQLTHEQTVSVIANCRLLDITFGNAYLALAQVAMTRVLYRRYLRGEISEDEWEYRKRQPHISGGPLNLRPFLDEQWFNNGGAGEFMLSISFFLYQLPFMTLGTTGDLHRRRELVLSDGAPPFPALLTFERFLHRADMVKQQSAAFLKHPLFHEIAGASHIARLERTRANFLQWVGSIENGLEANDDDVLAVPDIPPMLAHGGSSIGNVDLISPTEYPLPPTHPLSPRSTTPHPLRAGYTTSPTTPSPDSEKPKFVVEYSRVHLHARPTELYLGAATSRGQLRMHVFYDGNVFEDQVVQEWLDEVREAVMWYLGQTHRSSRGGPARDDNGVVSNVGLKAKL